MFEELVVYDYSKVSAQRGSSLTWLCALVSGCFVCLSKDREAKNWNVLGEEKDIFLVLALCVFLLIFLM